jgi:hypothetical protein
MTDLPDTDPIGDDELIYRRVPVSQNLYDAKLGLSPQAFSPDKKRDDTGISVNRNKYATAEQSAVGSSKKGYYFAVLKVAQLRANGIEVTHQPLPENAAHCEIPALNAANYDSPEVERLKHVLASIVVEVQGPFPPASVQAT